MIFRFIPKSLYAACLADWSFIRSVEVILAAALGLDSVVEGLRFRVFPEIYNPFASDAFSKCLKRDSLKHLGQAIGLSDFRVLQSNIISKHGDPAAIPIDRSDDTSDLQQGHSTRTALGNYTAMSDRPHGVRERTIQSYRRASLWWQHITSTSDLVFIGTCIDVGGQRSNCSNRVQRPIKRCPTTTRCAQRQLQFSSYDRR